MIVRDFITQLVQRCGSLDDEIVGYNINDTREESNTDTHVPIKNVVASDDGLTLVNLMGPVPDDAE